MSAAPWTAEGTEAVDEILSRKCVHVASDSFNYSYANNYKTLLKQSVTNGDKWAKAMIEGGVQNMKPLAPVVIYWGTADTVVPPVMHLKYMESVCKLGGEVTRVQLPGKITHFGTPAASESQYLSWLSDRFDGKPLPTANACGSKQGT